LIPQDLGRIGAKIIVILF